jgi:hypothetical protein
MNNDNELPPIGSLGDHDWDMILMQPVDGYWSSYSGAYSVLDGGPVEDISRESIARVDRSYGQSPEGGGSVDLALLVQLTNGSWAACVAWADYTGWGCQDGVQWKVAPNRELAISQGLDREARAKLEVSLLGE